MRIKILAASSLLGALQTSVPGSSRRTVRQMLAHDRVRLNGEPCNVAARRVWPGDVVEIRDRKITPNLPASLRILWEDDAILAICKPAGLLSVATLHEREKTAYAYLRRYLRSRSARHKLYVVHRLDKFASGILVFAKSEGVKEALRARFAKHAIQRKYWAIVEGRVEKSSGTIQSYLAEGQSLRMHSTRDPSKGKHAVTHYRVLRRFPNLTALEVTLETGRKNQIRAHLSEMEHPIVGDRAYGSVRNTLGRLGLHAFYLGFIHPTEHTPMVLETDAPREFRRYLGESAQKTSSG